MCVYVCVWMSVIVCVCAGSKHPHTPTSGLFATLLSGSYPTPSTVPPPDVQYQYGQGQHEQHAHKPSIHEVKAAPIVDEVKAPTAAVPKRRGSYSIHDLTRMAPYPTLPEHLKEEGTGNSVAALSSLPVGVSIRNPTSNPTAVAATATAAAKNKAKLGWLPSSPQVSKRESFATTARFTGNKTGFDTSTAPDRHRVAPGGPGIGSHGHVQPNYGPRTPGAISPKPNHPLKIHAQNPTAVRKVITPANSGMKKPTSSSGKKNLAPVTIDLSAFT